MPTALIPRVRALFACVLVVLAAVAGQAAGAARAATPAPAAAAPAGAAAPSWQGPGYEEEPIASGSPGASLVDESYVSIAAPLPASDGPHPAACDRIGYLRWRAASGPDDPTRADAIFVAQPGVLEGAGAFDQVARNTVLDALQDGYHVEFWAISRRSNCLVDPTGIQAAVAARDPQVALGYYFGGQAVEGRTFPGVVTEQDAAWLRHVGLAQTVQDEYAIISQLPPAVRETKVMCGGHSLGGLITGAFANWDFSGVGDPADAGYNQCAGYFSLESRFELNPSMAVLAAPVGGLLNGILGAVSGAFPYVDVPPVTPETEYALPILGMASAWSPDARSTLLAQLPNDFNFDFTDVLLSTDSWSDFLHGVPDIRRVNATNEAVLGTVFGDESQPIGFLRASLGAPAGGPLVRKSFPVAFDSPPVLFGLLGGQPQIAVDPADVSPSGPLYRWLNYDQVTAPESLPQDPTVPYATPTTEVSDIGQFSRALYEAAPALFTEPYFPTQLAEDAIAATYGDRSGTLRDLRYADGILKHPAVYVDGGQGLSQDLDPHDKFILPSPPPLVHVLLPGYNHLDVLTAARTQNDGRPEQSSATLASWVEQVVGP